MVHQSSGNTLQVKINVIYSQLSSVHMSYMPSVTSPVTYKLHIIGWNCEMYRVIV